jgi:hypothetical protein
MICRIGNGATTDQSDPRNKAADRAAPCRDRYVVHGLVVRSPFSFLQLTIY